MRLAVIQRIPSRLLIVSAASLFVPFCVGRRIEGRAAPCGGQARLAAVGGLVRPRLVGSIQLDRREVTRETIEGILGLYLLYMGALLVGGFAMTMTGLDLASCYTASGSALHSIGPGLGTVGAARNFADVPFLGMYLLSFGMLLGRPEIYTVLVLFTPHFRRKG